MRMNKMVNQGAQENSWSFGSNSRIAVANQEQCIIFIMLAHEGTTDPIYCRTGDRMMREVDTGYMNTFLQCLSVKLDYVALYSHYHRSNPCHHCRRRY